MDNYNFWADLLTTYRSNPDWLKFLWLVVPAAMLVLAGHGVARLIRHAIHPAAKPPSPPPSPPPCRLKLCGWTMIATLYCVAWV